MENKDFGFLFAYEHLNKDGELLYKQDFQPNQMTNEGFENMFDVYYRAGTAPASFEVGLATNSNPLVDITEFADGGTGFTTVTSAGHGLQNGDTVIIYESTNYDGLWNVSSVSGDNYNINATYVANPGETGKGKKNALSQVSDMIAIVEPDNAAEGYARAGLNKDTTDFPFLDLDNEDMQIRTKQVTFENTDPAVLWDKVTYGFLSAVMPDSSEKLVAWQILSQERTLSPGDVLNVQVMPKGLQP